MTEAAGLWEAWAKRWDRFQETYVPAREEQFQIIADYLAVIRSAGALRLLDLCSGPGSAGSRFLQARPGARVVAVDWDPWLLELGRRTAPGASQIAWVEADLCEARWIDALPQRAFEAAVVTTAMQWFTPEETARLYGDVAALLVRGGVFLLSIRAASGPDSVRTLVELAQLRWQERAHDAPGGEHWASFWDAARREPAFVELLAERDRRFAGRYPRASRPLAFHEDALQTAGFTGVGEVWRHHETVIVLALC
jgi:SAM-dependent methyltransferase